MKEYPVCHTTVNGGVFDAKIVERVETLLDSHNFVNRVDLLVKSTDIDRVQSCIQLHARVKKLVFESTLLQLVSLLLQLGQEDRSSLKLVTLNKSITHDDNICITSGKLTLKLRSDQYLKSGFQFKKSAFSKGNKNLKNQMYIHSFDLVNFEDNVKNNSKNDIRLLWFAENLSTENFKFMLTSELDDLEAVVIPHLLKQEVRILENKEILPQLSQLKDALCPDLTIIKDEDILAETLEWLTYASICGSQLQKDIDPFISRYPAMLESTERTNLTIISLSKALISSRVQKSIFKNFSETLEWFAMLSYGVKNVTRSYNNSGEHTFVDDGTNDIVLFSHNKQYALWRITDSGDSH